ncbi:acyltransferase family protein [Psychromicrobium xiongbiense]|uniref:acyltransferase family protein n=1 Tax=Psychromicrobium xiongbiense TaxID=3051184 RepID=UPI002552C773|nr:acyltransferase family protein [Psychromicrobium sp. YIM S02556]
MHAALRTVDARDGASPDLAQQRSRTGRVRTTGQHSFRSDLEGLRAVAVLAVVADHLFHRPSGGYMGVDVFFVLSGFLITGLLLREVDRTGRISFADFYRRRARRIFPAAILVLAATVAAAFLIFRIGKALGVLNDAFWAAIFVGNWQQALSGTDYMNAGSAASPLQHYWSLGVEEQFYLLWPVLILVLAWLARRLRWGQRSRAVLLGIVVTLVVAASFVFALWDTANHPTVAYFSTLSRGWELGLGALTAICAPLFSRLPLAVRVILGWLGLAVIVFSAFWLTPSTAFPGPWAILPVAGSVLIVIAGIGTSGRGYPGAMFLLTNPVSRYIGKISFSLYLWHFPVVILLEPFFAAGDRLYYVAAGILMVGLSVLSFHCVENPIRRSHWLEPRPAVNGRRVRRHRDVRARMLWIPALAVIVAVATAGFQLSRPTTPLALPVPSASLAPIVVPGPEASNSASASATAPAFPDPQPAQTAAIQAALNTPQWPALSPDLDQFGNAGQAVKAPEWIKDGCLGTNESQVDDPIANAAHCVYGDPNGKHTLVLYGDSVDISYLPGIRAALAGQSWKIYVYTVAGCPVSAVKQTQIGGAPFPECDAFRDWVVGQIASLKPDLVVMSEFRWDPVLISKASGPAADAERAAGYDATLSRVAGVAKRILLLAAPPEGKLLASCATRVSTPADCVAAPSASYERTVGIESAAIAKLGVKASYVKTEPWFCVDGKCPAFIGSTPMHADQYHLTAAGSVELAPLLAQAMRQALSAS